MEISRFVNFIEYRSSVWSRGYKKISMLTASELEILNPH